MIYILNGDFNTLSCRIFLDNGVNNVPIAPKKFYVRPVIKKKIIYLTPHDYLKEILQLNALKSFVINLHYLETQLCSSYSKFMTYKGAAVFF